MKIVIYPETEQEAALLKTGADEPQIHEHVTAAVLIGANYRRLVNAPMSLEFLVGSLQLVALETREQVMVQALAERQRKGIVVPFPGPANNRPVKF